MKNLNLIPLLATSIIFAPHAMAGDFGAGADAGTGLHGQLGLDAASGTVWRGIEIDDSGVVAVPQVSLSYNMEHIPVQAWFFGIQSFHSDTAVLGGEDDVFTELRGGIRAISKQTGTMVSLGYGYYNLDSSRGDLTSQEIDLMLAQRLPFTDDFYVDVYSQVARSLKTDLTRPGVEDSYWYLEVGARAEFSYFEESAGTHLSFLVGAGWDLQQRVSTEEWLFFKFGPEAVIDLDLPGGDWALLLGTYAYIQNEDINPPSSFAPPANDRRKGFAMTARAGLRWRF